jgi:N-acetylglutamate synthase-like GNAT family acetyltransferase
MNTYKVRRATTDDLAQMVALWQSLQMPALELERHFTDFQLVEDANNVLVGAIAVQLLNGEGHIHSETIPDFSLADTIRPFLWERIQSVARNNGLMRLWTEETALFWKTDASFSEATAEQLQHLPEAFGKRHPGWLALQLRSEESSPEAIQLQVDLITATHEEEIKAAKRKAQDMVVKGKTLTIIGLLIGAILFLIGLFALFRVMQSETYQ